MKKYPPLTEQFKTYLKFFRNKCWGNIRLTTKEERSERLSICHSCTEYNPRKKRCYQCGCFVELKAQHWDQICTLNCWPMFKEPKMGIFKSELQNSLTGLNALFYDGSIPTVDVPDVTISATDPKADIFIVFNKENLEKHLLEMDDLGMVFVPTIYKEHVGNRPFCFYFQPHWNFNVESFFDSRLVYFGNMDSNTDSHGNCGGCHPIFAAIKFCLYLGISKLDFDLNVAPPEKDKLKLNLRLKDIYEANSKIDNNFQMSPFSFSVQDNRIPVNEVLLEEIREDN